MSIVSEVAQAYFELVALDNELNIVRQTLYARKEGVRPVSYTHLRNIIFLFIKLLFRLPPLYNLSGL